LTHAFYEFKTLLTRVTSLGLELIRAINGNAVEQHSRDNDVYATT